MIAAHLERWRMACRVWGPEAPAARAAFGRYVARRAGVLTAKSADPAAWVAWERARRAGWMNRTHRRAISRPG